MEGIGGDAAHASTLIRDLAMQMNVPSASSSQSALQLLDEIDQGLQDVMQRLPQAFLKPLLPEGNLNNEQVGTSGLDCYGEGAGSE